MVWDCISGEIRDGVTAALAWLGINFYGLGGIKSKYQ